MYQTGPSLTSLAGPLIAVTFYFYCLYDFSQTNEAEIRTYSKQAWVLILVFGNIAGALLWLRNGRPRR